MDIHLLPGKRMEILGRLEVGWEKSGVLEHKSGNTLENFQGTIYWAHRAVIFAIAQLSCY